MRCSNCNSEAAKGDAFCPFCGKDLGEERAASKRKRAKIVAVIAIVAVLLIAAAAIAVITKGCSKSGETNASVSGTAVPTEAAVTEAPTAEPTPDVTETATEDATEAPDVTEAVVTEAPAEDTPAPIIEEPPLRTDDVKPIDGLVAFMLKGDPDSARSALPGEYITHLAGEYGAAARLLGENNVIRIAGLVVKNNLASEYGKITEIRYELISRRAMTEAEMKTAISELVALGVNSVPTEGHLLDVKLIFTGDGKEQTLLVAPRVLLFEGDVWYLHPADIDSMT